MSIDMLAAMSIDMRMSIDMLRMLRLPAPRSLPSQCRPSPSSQEHVVRLAEDRREEPLLRTRAHADLTCCSGL